MSSRFKTRRLPTEDGGSRSPSPPRRSRSKRSRSRSRSSSRPLIDPAGFSAPTFSFSNVGRGGGTSSPVRKIKCRHPIFLNILLSLKYFSTPSQLFFFVVVRHAPHLDATTDSGPGLGVPTVGDVALDRGHLGGAAAAGEAAPALAPDPGAGVRPDASSAEAEVRISGDPLGVLPRGVYPRLPISAQAWLRPALREAAAALTSARSRSTSTTPAA